MQIKLLKSLEELHTWKKYNIRIKLKVWLYEYIFTFSRYIIMKLFILNLIFHLIREKAYIILIYYEFSCLKYFHPKKRVTLTRLSNFLKHQEYLKLLWAWFTKAMGERTQRGGWWYIHPRTSVAHADYRPNCARRFIPYPLKSRKLMPRV